jgi:hypothetical protein
MNSQTINVVPQDQTTVKTINSFSVVVDNLVLFKNVTLNVKLFDENNKLISIQTIEVGGDDYTNWGGDDTYITNYAAQKLGLQIISS